MKSLLAAAAIGFLTASSAFAAPPARYAGLTRAEAAMLARQALEQTHESRLVLDGPDAARIIDVYQGRTRGHLKAWRVAWADGNNTFVCVWVWVPNSEDVGFRVARC